MTIRNVIVACDYAYIEGGSSQSGCSDCGWAVERSNLKVYFFAGCWWTMPGVSSNFCTGDFAGNVWSAQKSKQIRCYEKRIYNRKAGKLHEDLLNTLKENETIIHVHTWTKVLSVQSLLLRIKKYTSIFDCAWLFSYMSQWRLLRLCKKWNLWEEANVF